MRGEKEEAQPNIKKHFSMIGKKALADQIPTNFTVDRAHTAPRRSKKSAEKPAITAMIFEVIIWCISCRKFEARAFICFIDLAGAEEELLTA